MPAILTCTASTTNTKNLNYLPQQIYFESATEVTSIKVEVLGAPAPIFDSTTDGIATLGKAFRTSQITNGFVIPLANGFIGGKNVTITVVTPAGATPTIYGESPSGYGDQYFITSQAKAFAGSPFSFAGRSFDFLSFEDGTAATDILNVTYADGFTETGLLLTELKAMNSVDFGITNGIDDYYLQNLNDNIIQVTYVPTADTTIITGIFVAA